MLRPNHRGESRRVARTVGTIVSRTESRFWGVLRPLDWSLLSILGHSGMAPFLADRIAAEILEIDRRGLPGPLEATRWTSVDFGAHAK